jgi:leucyl aminopeptidase
MRFELVTTPLEQLQTDLLVVLLDSENELARLPSDKLKGIPGHLNSGFVSKKIKREFFSQYDEKIRHLLIFHTMLDSNYNIWEKVKIFASKALGYGKDFDFKKIAVLLDGKNAPSFLGKIAEGLILGGYSYDKFKKEKDTFVAGLEVQLVIDPAAEKESESRLARYRMVSDAANEARQIVNDPGAEVTPEVLASLAIKIGQENHLAVQVKNEKNLVSEGFTGLQAVGKGSIHPPRLITLEYQPEKESAWRLALVGKGVTFDSGGISLKPSEKMLEMKGDMAGASAVLYTMKVLARLKPPFHVLGIIPTCENFPDANAQRPGDIFIARNGKSVQVDNTDAEGRLILTDAFSLAGDWKATHMIDVATLTGAAIRALGQGYAAIMGNSQKLIESIIHSGRNHGEFFWQLPLPPEYKELLKTPYADINNVGGPYAGAITGGLFLQEFVPEKIAWAHLDIAGPFLFDKPWKYYKEGATAFGLKTLVDLCEQWGEYFKDEG